ncbi:SIR2 family protein [Nannocystaceae bacterium ST9]
MSGSSFDRVKLENLAERIYQGQVVFFVGAGFSLDSENLTAYRLMLRLLARFDGFSWVLARMRAPGSAIVGDVAARASELRRVLRDIFDLASKSRIDPREGPLDDDRLTNGDDAWKLQLDYYRANDWFCSAFGTLLELAARVAIDWDAIGERERQLLAGVPVRGRVESLIAIDPELLGDHPIADRGKALFVDTLGFADAQVMAGRPHAPSVGEVARSYADAGHRLRPRHHVLARWAREGLCMVLLTTNYDLLLEGAYRLAGFACRHCDEPGREPDPPALFTDVSHFSRIGEAVEFFRFGNTHRSALIAKIHGCAERYRELRGALVEARARHRKSPTREHKQALEAARRSFASYLPAIVFTFREIQNWRRDAWSRDLLANLLRTRSIVFCGYSAQDRVLHDAFRTVYEEISAVHARVRADAPALAELQTDEEAVSLGAGHAVETSAAHLSAAATMAEANREARRARAFFLGGAGRLEFDALEVLRAASRAEGEIDPSQTGHPNYIQFHFEREGQPQGFPGLDQTLRWLWHRTYRIRQQESVESDLRRIATTLLGHACPERERQVVAERLAELARCENHCAEQWEREPPEPQAFDRIVAWTDRFQVALLREFAIGETLMRRHGPGFSIQSLLRQPWYFPASEHSDWTAWGVVIEVALRRMIACWRLRAVAGGDGQRDAEGVEGLASWAQPTPTLSPARRGRRPLVGFSGGRMHQPDPPNGLEIALLGLGRQRRSTSVRGAYVGPIHRWWLRGQAIPWWGPEVAWGPEGARDPEVAASEASPSQVPEGTPTAATLWAWAAGREPTTPMLAELDRLLGVDRTLGAGRLRSLQVA